MTEKSLVERAKGWLENDSKYRPKPVSEISPRIIKDIRELCQAVVEASRIIKKYDVDYDFEPSDEWLRKYGEVKDD